MYMYVCYGYGYRWVIAILQTGGCATQHADINNNFCDISGPGGGMRSTECRSS